VARTSGGTP